MDRLKTFAKYAIWFILFFFFSNILIFIGLNANYKSINTDENSNNPSQVQINQAEATAVNGRIKGTITNDGEEDLNGKYMKVDLYSSNNTLLGTEYMEMNEMAQGAQDDFELYFKAQDVDHYNISFVDKVADKVENKVGDKVEEINNLKKVEFLKRPVSNYELLMLLIALMIIG